MMSPMKSSPSASNTARRCSRCSVVAPAWQPRDQAGSGAHPQFLSTENAVDAIGFLETFAQSVVAAPGAGQSVDGFVPRLDDAQALFEHVWAEGRTLLYAHEARQLLSAFGIAMTNTGIARTPTEAVTLADSLAIRWC